MSWAPAASSSSSGSQHSTLPIYKYKNKAVTSMVMLRGQGACKYAMLCHVYACRMTALSGKWHLAHSSNSV